MVNFKHVVVAAAAAGFIVLGAAACDDDTDTAGSATSASQASVDEVSARVQRNEMMSAVLVLRTLDLHGMDETLNEEGTIDSSFAPNTRTAVRVLALTDWSDEFAADAESVRGHAADLLKALEAEDVDAAAAAATELHETEHDLDAAVWNEIAKDLPPDEGGPEAEHEETPGAEEGEGDEYSEEGTPAAEATP